MEENVEASDIKSLTLEECEEFNSGLEECIEYLESHNTGGKINLPLRGEGLENFLECDYWNKHESMKYWNKHHGKVIFIPEPGLQTEELLNWMTKSKKSFYHNRSKIMGCNWLYIFKG